MLSLLAEAAEAQPLLCVIDDEQRLDHVLDQTSGFVARPLGADPLPSGAGSSSR